MRNVALGATPLLGFAVSMSQIEQGLRIFALLVTILTGLFGLYYLVKNKGTK